MEINQLLLSKYLLNRGQEFLRKDDEIACGIAVSLFQDSSEILLRAIAKQVDADVSESDKYMQFWDKIKKAPKNESNKDVPKKAQMTEVNKARVSFKHYGHTPAYALSSQLADYTESFIRECLSTFFGIDFDSISMADALTDSSLKNKIKEGEQLFREKQYQKCVVACAAAESIVSSKFEEILPWPRAKDKIRDLYSFRQKNREVASFFDALLTDLTNQRALITASLLNLNLADMIKFKNMAPLVEIGHERKEFVTFIRQVDFTEEDALFCLKFVTDYAFIIENKIANIERERLFYFYKR